MQSDCDDSTAALAALRALREATERAVSALERDDPDSARAALDEGGRASRDLELYDAHFLQQIPGARAEFEVIRVLQAMGIQCAEKRSGETQSEIESYHSYERGLRGYRPGGSAPDSCVDLES
ncbi:MAG: hypothetical protein ACKVS6_08800 [Planctomycetota bacterium]